MDFDSTRPWRLGAGVALRPEPFGALAYNFDNRSLSFLKSHEITSLVRSLAEFDSADAAMDSIPIPTSQREPYIRALDALARKGMVTPRVLGGGS